MDPAARSFRFSCRSWLRYFDWWVGGSSASGMIIHIVSVVVVVTIANVAWCKMCPDDAGRPKSLGIRLRLPAILLRASRAHVANSFRSTGIGFPFRFFRHSALPPSFISIFFYPREYLYSRAESALQGVWASEPASQPIGWHGRLPDDVGRSSSKRSSVSGGAFHSPQFPSHRAELSDEPSKRAAADKARWSHARGTDWHPPMPVAVTVLC